MGNDEIRQLLTGVEKTAAGLEIKPELKSADYGTVISFVNNIAGIQGLLGVKSDEIIEFENKAKAIVFNLEPDIVFAAMLDSRFGVKAGMSVKSSGKTTTIAAGDALLGRVIDPLGNPLDNKGMIKTQTKYPIERKAPPIFDRQSVRAPLYTGILPVDALIPIGRGQRELIIGDRQTGKTALAVDAIINQKGRDVICVYCSIGRPLTGTAKVIADLEKYQALEYTVVVNASGDETPAVNFLAPYSATSIAEWFMEKGKDVLIVYDDLTSHARSYRELSLLLRRPPAREAYPGDIFFIHSRLLERATHLKDELGGGSITALPVVETEAQNISAYIPTNLVSITDGQIYLSPKLFASGIMPAVDVGRSVSRVGGNAQVKAYHKAAGALKLSYSQYEELEAFSRFGTKLDEETKKSLARGRVIKEISKQPQYSPLSVTAQIGMLTGLNTGMYESLREEEFASLKDKIYKALENAMPDKIKSAIESGEKLDEKMEEEIKNIILNVINNRGQSGVV